MQAIWRMIAGKSAATNKRLIFVRTLIPVIGNRYFFPFVAGALIVLVLGVSLPSSPRILGVLNNAAHAPVFGTFALIALRLIRERRRYATVRPSDYVLGFLVTIGVGGLVEIAQAFIGVKRHQKLHP